MISRFYLKSFCIFYRFAKIILHNFFYIFSPFPSSYLFLPSFTFNIMFTLVCFLLFFFILLIYIPLIYIFCCDFGGGESSQLKYLLYFLYIYIMREREGERVCACMHLFACPCMHFFHICWINKHSFFFFPPLCTETGERREHGGWGFVWSGNRRGAGQCVLAAQENSCAGKLFISSATCRIM